MRFKASGLATTVYRMVDATLAARSIHGSLIIDIGCGTGALRSYIQSRFVRYIGVDLVKYSNFPDDAEFVEANLDNDQIPLDDGLADAAISVRTIEHLENPRALMREIARIVRPGGWVIVTTPNQLSLVSLVSLIMRARFQFFQDVHYPAHITPLIEVDLVRIAKECGLDSVAIEYSESARMPLTPRAFPQFMSRAFPRALSDNLLLLAKKPANTAIS